MAEGTGSITTVAAGCKGVTSGEKLNFPVKVILIHGSRIPLIPVLSAWNPPPSTGFEAKTVFSRSPSQ